MTKTSNANSELKRLRGETRLQQDEINTLRRDVHILRGRLTKAEQDAAEWKRRFDDLLARVPLKPIEVA